MMAHCSFSDWGHSVMVLSNAPLLIMLLNSIRVIYVIEPYASKI